MDKKTDNKDSQYVIYSQQKEILDIVLMNLKNIESDSSFLGRSFADIGVDSIGFVKIVVAIENKYNFEFEDEMLQSTCFLSIYDFVNYVINQISAN